MNRTFVYLLVGYVLTVLQASLQGLVPFRIFVPELGLLVVLHLGFTARAASSACAAALLIGYVTDLLAGSPKGLHALVFVLLCLLAKGASLRLLLRGNVLVCLFAFLFSLVSATLLLVTGSQAAGGTLAPLQLAPLQAATTALFAPLVFRFLRRLDGRMGRTPAPGLGL